MAPGRTVQEVVFGSRVICRRAHTPGQLLAASNAATGRHGVAVGAVLRVAHSRGMCRIRGTLACRRGGTRPCATFLPSEHHAAATSGAAETTQAGRGPGVCTHVRRVAKLLEVRGHELLG